MSEDFGHSDCSICDNAKRIEKIREVSKVSHDAIVRKWPLYQTMVRDRLLIGAEQYGDTSFGALPDKLLAEIQQELLDVTGWAFILWCRIQELQQELMEKKDVG